MKNMKAEQPLVSIIITNWNYGRYIKKAIDSVLKQDYKNWELIIVDDGSTDDSLKVIEKIVLQNHDKPIRLFALPKNEGPCFSRNKGLATIKGDYFIFVDADDTIPENFISEMAAAAVYGKLDVVYCDLSLRGIYDNVMKISTQSVKNLINFSAAPVCQLTKSKWAKSHKFDSYLNRLANEDNDFFFGLFADGAKFGKTNKTTYNYFVHKEGRAPKETDESYYKPRVYILKKYSDRYPEVLDGIVTLFASKDRQIKELENRINEMAGEINNRDAIIDDKDKHLNTIINSRSYKIGRSITAPIRKIRG